VDTKRREQRREAHRLKEQGLSVREIGTQLGCCKSTAAEWVRSPVPAPADELRALVPASAAPDDPEIPGRDELSERLLSFAARSLRSLELRLPEATYRELVGGMKVAAELALAMERTGRGASPLDAGETIESILAGVYGTEH